jgi:hypothetical protein
MTDKKLAREFIRKVSPLEHSKNPVDRKNARKLEKRFRAVIRSIPKKRIRA